ncbi:MULTISPECIES: hypothetical protein [Pseudomonas]|uniref:Uncharacterized protein n=1 Tax=Pseudomonas aphyarum TaxID=2942629 RepID=A0ABT5PKA3_9PSED|nr:hypothetical protein [Pseudomonas aphyarum]MDD0968427.1 hypothetical protein [Pseudomonas aphyarum]MDD1124327.1 hypothetical protein [Pseudomonas aphyarum]
MAAPKKKQAQTTEQHATTQVTGTLAQDYVTVVGASYMSTIENWRGQKGNKMRFINQGIRQLTKYPEGTPSFSKQRVFLIFKDDYPQNLLAALKLVVERDHGAQYRELDSISGLVDFIFTRQRRGREIKQLDFFSHGVVGAIELGYELDKRESYRLRDAQAKMFKPEAFAYGAKIHSYACRTGLGINAERWVLEGEDPHYELSLAQIMANATRTTVMAFPRRSNYDTTYGTNAERQSVPGTRQRMVSDREAMESYTSKNIEYQRKLAEHRKTAKNPTAELPDEKAPQKPLSTVTDEERKLVAHEDSRSFHEKTVGYPLDALGAHRDVRSGDTPTGVPAHLLEYRPA